MNTKVILRKFLSLFLIFAVFANTIILPTANAVSTNGAATPWTMEKAEHLAKRALIWVNPQVVTDLYNAWSATAAVNMLFPSVNGPDRTAYNAEEETFKWVAFNPSDTNAMRKLYAFRYYKDPYEAKRKLFGLFEDIFPIDRTWVGVNDINFPDVENHFNVLFSETLGNYKTMVRKVFFDVSKPENSFAMGRYLDLLNQPDKNYPNENYARELMQLFLMLEYKPWEDAETPDSVRNYTEADVASLAKLISGFRAGDDKKVYFDMNYHNTWSSITFLTWSLKAGDSFPFYNSASGTIDNTLLVVPRNGNNGVADNILDYIFSKREAEIADFLAWRMIKYYIKDKPTQAEIEGVAAQIIANNFDIYPTIKSLLASNMMYSEEAMNSIRYKNPLELTIGTLKQLHYKNPSVIDGLLSDTNLLSNLDWAPYNPRSIFGRPGFDENTNFMNAYFHNQWTTYTSKLAFTTGTGYYDLSELIPVTRKTTGIATVMTHSGNTYSGSINLSNITITINENAFPFVAPQSVEEVFASWAVPIAVTQETSTGETSQDASSDTASGSQETLPVEIVIPETSTGSQEVLPSLERVPQEKVWNDITPPSEELPTVEPVKVESTPTPAVEESNSEDTISETPTASIGSKIYSYFVGKAHADIVSANTITFATWVIVLPEFYILTSSGNRINLEWSYNLDTNSLSISSGSLSYGTGNYAISSSTFTINPGANIQRDINPDEMITQLEDYLYLGKRLPTTVKDEMKNYLLKTDTGTGRLFLPNNTTYRNKFIRSIISMMLVQPEFMLQSGFDAAVTPPGTGNTPINNAASKLVMIELYGWYDWMNGIIPKSDFNYYQDIRKDLSITGSNLIDLGSVYMNKSLEALKPFYDSGELRIVNRVGAPNHSRWHDTAAIQISSQKALQTVGTPGMIGELIKNESNPLNHIVLWSGNPPIYTNGKFINIWGNSILYKNNVSGTTAEKTYQISTLRNVLNARTYPATSSAVFKNSLTLDDVGRSGQETTGYTLSGRLNFTHNLMNNGLWITYYVWGWGWYDTHGDQLKTGTWQYNLNDRTRDLTNDIVWFFNKAKASGKDLTIVVFSEFWRTLKTNGTTGTDHGAWGGYFILTTNNGLKLSMPNKVMWKLSPEKEYEDWFGVWIDYRSIFTKILTVLYNINTSSHFLWDYDLDDDLNTVIPNPVLLRTEYDNTYSNNVSVDLKFKVDDKNFIFRDGSYIKLYHGTNSGALNQYSRWTIDNYTYNQATNSFKINFNLTRNTKYYYRLEIVDNQYDNYTASGFFIVPDKVTNVNTIQIPLTSDSYFSKYDATTVSNVDKNIPKLVLYDNPLQAIVNSWSTLTGSTSSGSTSSGSTSSGSTSSGVTYTGSVKMVSFSGGLSMTFGTGETSISTLYGSWVWNGWIVLPRILNKGEFLSDYAKYNNFLNIKKDASIDNMVQVGPDTLWVGMKLSQKVDVTIPLTKTYDDYTILTSVDGISWSDLPGASETATGGKITFSTDRLGYFAVMGLYNATPIDTTPDLFSFTPVSNANLSSLYTSNTITVTGIDVGTEISVVGWEYSVNGWLFKSATGTVYAGNTITLRATTPNAYSTATSVTLNIGWVIATYTVTTKANSSSWGWSSGGGSSGGWSSGWWSSGWGSSWWGSSGWSSGWGGGWGWSSKDKCPNWDYSPSYYDKKCGTKPTTPSKPVVKDKAYYQALKQQILQDRMNAHKTGTKTPAVSTQTGTQTSWDTAHKLSKVKYNNFEISYVKWYAVSDKTKTLALQIVNSKNLSSEQKKAYITRVNEYLQANYNYDFAASKTRELKNKVSKQEILLKWVIKNLK